MNPAEGPNCTSELPIPAETRCPRASDTNTHTPPTHPARLAGIQLPRLREGAERGMQGPTFISSCRITGEVSAIPVLLRITMAFWQRSLPVIKLPEKIHFVALANESECPDQLRCLTRACHLLRCPFSPSTQLSLLLDTFSCYYYFLLLTSSLLATIEKPFDENEMFYKHI